MIRLLFFKSNTKPNNYGEREKHTRFWTGPAAILLAAAVFFGTGAENRLSNGKPVLFSTWHCFDKRDMFSADVAHGEGMGHSFKPTGETPFSEYTEEDFSNLSATYGTAEALAMRYSFRAETISDFRYGLEDINGKQFVHVSFSSFGGVVLQHWIIGIYESKEYRFSFALRPDADILTRYSIQHAIRSIRVGQDAIP